MTNDRLNQYIKHYIEKDKTGRAIMLTGPWGVGKSYYIKNNLIPYLSSDENGAHRCVVISLYGLSNITEISKAIYLETRLNMHVFEKEAGKATLLTAKTVFKSFTSFLGIDLKANEEDLQALYRSIDLAGKLIILEDVERSKIDILELLGYVNSIVEQDNVKVLLVTNEKEIIHYKPVPQEKDKDNDTDNWSDESPKNSESKEYTVETLQYLEVKEKSISDTIIFEGDLYTAIREIINSFDNKLLQQFSQNQYISDIVDIMVLTRSENLRSFIFACQKTADIYEYLQSDDISYTEDFLKTIFYSIVAFSMRLHTKGNKRWIGLEHYSQELGLPQYPLFRFCYDYILTQYMDVSAPHDADVILKKLRLYDQNKSSFDPDLNILTSFHIHTEIEVKEAVDKITLRLHNPEDLSFYDYGRIAVSLVMVKYSLGLEIDNAKEYLIANLKARGNEIKEDDLFWSILSCHSKEEQDEFTQLRDDMIRSLGEGRSIIPDFDYLPEQTISLYNYVIKNEGIFYEARGFAKYLDIPRFVIMFLLCTPAQMEKARGTFIAIYRPLNIKQFFGEDLSAIEELLTTLESNQPFSNMDKVQNLQIKWFIENLTEIRNKLS